jgi:hypothetical protein
MAPPMTGLPNELKRLILAAEDACIPGFRIDQSLAIRPDLNFCNPF